MTQTSEIYIATHPRRVRIAQELSKEGRLSSTQLAERMNCPAYLIDFHLSILEDRGLVLSEMAPGNSTADIMRVTYELAPKFREVLQEAAILLP